MQSIESFFNLHRQNSKLDIRLISPDFGHLPAHLTDQYGLTHRKPYYFFIFMMAGVAHHGVDLREFDVQINEMLFILPHQIHELPATKQGTGYFKLGFDEKLFLGFAKTISFSDQPSKQPENYIFCGCAFKTDRYF
jgi:AraC family transcriptional activator of pobA